jgi:CAAX prenyl protease-like protein
MFISCAVDPLTKKLRSSPTLARALPFVIFVLLTACQGRFGESSRYWFYLAKTVVGVWLIWAMRPAVVEMRWAFSWEAVAAGVGIFLIWVGLDGHYPSIGEIFDKISHKEKPAVVELPWNPNLQFGSGSALAWLFIIVRIVGVTIIVPPIEEVFYRSFVYRWIAKPDWESVPLGMFIWKSFLITAAMFGAAHFEWLAGILCAFSYQLLVCRKKRLGDAMTAHTITNFLLGVWIVWKGAWHFW